MKNFNLKWLLTDRELTRVERREVLEDLFVFGKDNQLPFLVRMGVLLILSSLIATAGLLSDSAAVVIGAMLVAPLMNPVLASAGAVVMGWPRRFYRSLWLVFLMGLGALLISSLITILSPDLIFIPEQVMARTRPTFYDLLIALAAGSAGAYTITRKESSAIPGVAVAVALLPPLASAGILATTGEYDLAIRAVVLFLTNLVAMVLAGALTFSAVGIAPIAARRKSAAFVRNQLSLFLALTIAVSIPLWFYSEEILFNASYKAAKSVPLQEWLEENELELTSVDISKNKGTLTLGLEGPNPPVNVDQLHETLLAGTAENPDLPFVIKYTWTQKVSGVWPQKASTIDDMAKQVRASTAQIMGRNWVWEATQYDSETAAGPGKGESYTLYFNKKGKLQIFAPCGSLKGKYVYNGRKLVINMSRNLFSGCRNSDMVKIFTEDLESGSTTFIEKDRLQITLSDGGGMMSFRKE